MSRLYRVSELSQGSRSAVIFVHGLGGDAFATWRAGSEEGNFWPRWLAHDLPEIDVWTVEYEASPSNWQGSAMALPDRAANLLGWFEAERLCEKNLVFITHSLGGLVVKQLLRLSADRPGTSLGRVLEATEGVVFLGTPNTGTDLATWMDRLRGLLGTSLATKDLQADSAYLRELNGWYREHGPAEDISTLVFAETRATKGLTVVEQASADPGIPGVLAIPVDADHLSIAKPENRDELVYKRIKSFIEERLPTTSLTGLPQPESPLSRRFFLSYRRSAQEDARLAQLLCEELTKAGHEVFIDVQMAIGTDWARRIEERIDWCEFLVVMLSAESIISEMVQEEVRLAHQRRKRNGTPFILPVRVRYDGPLGYALGAYIERYQYVTWNSDRDTPAVLAQIADVSRTGPAGPTPHGQGGKPPASAPQGPTSFRPVPAADPRLLKQPGGALGLDDPAYIARAIDDRVIKAATQVGVTLVIKAPRQSGKTSLLIRYLGKCRQEGKQVALIDLQIFTASQLEDLAACLSRFARMTLRELALDPSLHRPIGAPDELTDFMEDVVFPKTDKRVVLGLDEVDRLIARTWRDDFFAMLRHWHNLSGIRPERGWDRFDLALVVATEPILLIADPNQSPFNVVEPLRLPPFSEGDLVQLNYVYGKPLDALALNEMLELLGGQPYLSRMVFFHLATEGGVYFPELANKAWSDGGPFGEHLRARLSEIARYPELADAYRRLLRRDTQPSPEIGHRLEALGLARRSVGEKLAPASLLYARYFDRAL